MTSSRFPLEGTWLKKVAERFSVDLVAAFDLGTTQKRDKKARLGAEGIELPRFKEVFLRHTGCVGLCQEVVGGPTTVEPEADDETSAGLECGCNIGEGPSPAAFGEETHDVAGGNGDVKVAFGDRFGFDVAYFEAHLGKIGSSIADEDGIEVRAYEVVTAGGQVAGDATGAAADINDAGAAGCDGVDESCLAIDVFALGDEVTPALSVVFRVLRVSCGDFFPRWHGNQSMPPLFLRTNPRKNGFLDSMRCSRAGGLPALCGPLGGVMPLDSVGKQTPWFCVVPWER